MPARKPSGSSGSYVEVRIGDVQRRHYSNPRRCVHCVACHEAAIEVQGLRKRFGDVQALCGIDLSAPPGTVLGPARPERRRQDHRRAHPHHAAAARRGTARVAGSRRGARTPPRCARRSASPASTPRSTRTSPASRTSRWSGRLYHLGRGPARERARRAARAVRAHRGRRPAREDLLRRHAPAPRPGRRAGGPARRCSSSTSPPPGLDPRSRLQLLGDDRGARGGRHHRAAHHPVPRRGRPARRPDRRDRPRPGDRRGHLRRAQGPRRRRAARGARSRTTARPTAAIEALAPLARRAADVRARRSS